MSDNNIRTDITDIDVTDNDYLSDEELDMLISMVEEKDVVEAPEYILNDILEHVDSKQSDMHDTVSEEINSLPPSKPEKPPKVVNISKRRRQYYAYCVKVSIAIAASIGIVPLPQKGSHTWLFSRTCARSMMPAASVSLIGARLEFLLYPRL